MVLSHILRVAIALGDPTGTSAPPEAQGEVRPEASANATSTETPTAPLARSAGVIVSVERLLPLIAHVSRGGDDHLYVGSVGARAVGRRGVSATEMARAAFDVNLRGPTLGARIAVGYHAGDSPQWDPSRVITSFAFRLGYVAPISSRFALWPRASIASPYSGEGGAASMIFEAALLLFPVKHAAITAGPAFDVGLERSGVRRSAIDTGILVTW